MTHYETLRAKRNEMLPERCKFEFGCEVKVRNEMYPKGYITVIRGIESFNQEIGGKAGRILTTNFAAVDDNDVMQILGQPVSIADVLRMLGSPYMCRADGQIWAYGDEEGWVEIAIIDLSRPLSEQEEACEKILAVLDSGNNRS